MPLCRKEFSERKKSHFFSYSIFMIDKKVNLHVFAEKKKGEVR